MSPKFYGYLWVLYFVTAGVTWLAGMLTLMAIIVFGFVAFGMVFIGMMCVLPAAVSHPTPKKPKLPSPQFEPATEKSAKGVNGFSTYRSA